MLSLLLILATIFNIELRDHLFFNGNLTSIRSSLTFAIPSFCIIIAACFVHQSSILMPATQLFLDIFERECQFFHIVVPSLNVKIVHFFVLGSYLPHIRYYLHSILHEMFPAIFDEIAVAQFKGFLAGYGTASLLHVLILFAQFFIVGSLEERRDVFCKLQIDHVGGGCGLDDMLIDPQSLDGGLEVCRQLFVILLHLLLESNFKCFVID